MGCDCETYLPTHRGKDIARTNMPPNQALSRVGSMQCGSSAKLRNDTMPEIGFKKKRPPRECRILFPTMLCISVSFLLLVVDPTLAFPANLFGVRPNHWHTAFVNQRFPLNTVPRHDCLSPLWSRAHNEDDDEFDNDDEQDFYLDVSLPDASQEQVFSRDTVERLTVAQLKQQLRLRGLKVSGRKSVLVERFLQHQQQQQPSSSAAFSMDEEEELKFRVKNGVRDPKRETKARKFAEDQGKELVDVTEYLEQDDFGKDEKIWKGRVGNDDEDDDEEDNKPREPEVWGAEARMVDDYEGDRLVVDCLSHSMVEFKGSNDSQVQAYVVASRDALKPYLAGGRNPINNATAREDTPAEERLREIQTKRERDAKRPVRMEDEALSNEGDEIGLYKDALHRDFSDWGKYTTTGAQLSASEVQGVLFLSDVYGAFNEDTKALAEKIAFECQPVVVMIPDLFRGEPWSGPTDGTNQRGQSYEEWRAGHPDLRVNVDIRAAAACLRERYGVSSVVVWGTCYGGGRALEAAAGWFPNRNIHDVNGNVGPPPVDPMACVAWYPTRYNLGDLFGEHHMGTVRTPDGTDRSMAVMAVFAGRDSIPGARRQDAEALKEALKVDKRVKDHMVKIFADQDHGFAHQGLSHSGSSDEELTFGDFVDEEFGGAGRISFADGDAEVACLLSTAFMETYSRVFLPTVGPPIQQESEWGQELEMIDRSKQNQNGRDVRKEIEKAESEFVEEPLDGVRIDPTDPSQEEEFIKLLRSMESADQKAGPFALEDDDDLNEIYAKMKARDDEFQIF